MAALTPQQGRNVPGKHKSASSIKGVLEIWTQCQHPQCFKQSYLHWCKAWTRSLHTAAALNRLLHTLDWHQCLPCSSYVFTSSAGYLNSSDTSVGVSCRSQVLVLRNTPLKYCAVRCALLWITVLFRHWQLHKKKKNNTSVLQMPSYKSTTFKQ